MGMTTAATPKRASTAKNQTQRRLRRDATMEVGTYTVLPAFSKALGQFRLGDHDDAPLGDQEAAAAVVLQVVTNRGVRRNPHVLVDDRLADVAMPADVHTIEKDRILDPGIAVDTDIRRQDAAAHVAAADDAALADHAVVGLAAAGAFRRPLVAEDELRRRQLR